MMCASGTISVLIVDDHAILREGLAYILEKNPGIAVAAAAASGTQAVAAARAHKPAVIVMDLVLPEMSGLDATRRILAELPDTRVIMLSMLDSPEQVFHALRAGALGDVLKQSAATEIVQAVLTVVKGRQYLSAELSNALAGMNLEHARQSPLESLSDREREVLYLTVASMTSGQIARRLSLSPKTVATYRGRIMEKLGVADRTSLIRYALQNIGIPR